YRKNATAPPMLRRIALRKLEGYTNKEIAGEIDATERTVERKLERIRARWEAGGGGAHRDCGCSGRPARPRGAAHPRITQGPPGITEGGRGRGGHHECRAARGAELDR